MFYFFNLKLTILSFLNASDEVPTKNEPGTLPRLQGEVRTCIVLASSAESVVRMGLEDNVESKETTNRTKYLTLPGTAFTLRTFHDHYNKDYFYILNNDFQ